MTRAFSIVGIGGLCVGLCLVIYAITMDSPPEPQRLGLRGLRRREMLDKGGIFALLDPLIRWLARWVAFVPLGSLRAKIDITLLHAGDWLGIRPNEFVALSLISSMIGLGFGFTAVELAEIPDVLMPFFFALGMILPWVMATSTVGTRQKQIGRTLPPTIDLMSLCMSAGLDFTGAVRQIVEKSGRPDEPLNEEFEVILSQLRLGVTRVRALETFAERVPIESVRQFVNAIKQSEERGNPLAEVLKLQAEAMRLQRSVSAEEAASKAAVMMMLPLMLIMGSIILILMGPFVIRGMNSGM